MKAFFKNTTLILLLIASLFIISCKKKDTSTTPVIPMGALYFHIHTDINNTEVTVDSTGIDASGRHFKMSLSQFYISGIVLTKSDGTTVPASNVYLLKTNGTQVYYVDSVPPATYSSMSFNIGIDAATNAKDPTTFIATSPLYLQNPSMWFSSTSLGYMFMNVQGMADTSSANNGAVNYPFTYQGGVDSLIRTVTLNSKAFTISSSAALTIDIIADYGKLFQGISFKSFASYSLTPYTNPSVAVQIANNIPGMFHYQ